MHRSIVRGVADIQSKVVLKKVNLKTSGTFRCEVTTRSNARNSKRFDSPTMESKLVVVGKMNLQMFIVMLVFYVHISKTKRNFDLDSNSMLEFCL